MANRFFAATSISGGTQGSLDNISSGILSYGDVAMVKASTTNTANHATGDDKLYFYRYANVPDVENLPKIVAPDDVAGDGRWLMISPSIFMEDIDVEVGKTLSVDTIRTTSGAGLSIGYSTDDMVFDGSDITLSKSIVSSGSVTLDDGTTDTPQFICRDSTLGGGSETQAYMDISADLWRIVTDYQGAGGVEALTIDTQTRVLESDGNVVFHAGNTHNHSGAAGSGGEISITATANNHTHTAANGGNISITATENNHTHSSTNGGNIDFNGDNNHTHTGTTTGGSLDARYVRSDTGDTMNGTYTITGGLNLNNSLELGSVGQPGIIDFKNAVGDDVDVRIRLDTDDVLNINKPLGGSAILQVNGTAVLDANNTVTSIQNKTFGSGSAIPFNVTAGSEAYIVPNLNADLLDGYEAADLFLPHSEDYISGMTMVRQGVLNEDIIDIGPGSCLDSTRTRVITRPSTLDRRITAFFGTANGGRATGTTLTNGSWWYIFAVGFDGGPSDNIAFDTSPTAAFLIANDSVDYYRRIGAFYYIDGTSLIRDFTQTGDQFMWADPVLDGTYSAALQHQATLSIPPRDGIVCKTICSGYEFDGGAGSFYLLIRNDDETQVNASSSLHTTRYVSDSNGFNNISQYVEIPMTSNAQLNISGNDVDYLVNVSTLGWIDYRTDT